MSNSPLRIGIAGLGTVGAGTIKLLEQQASLIAMRCGREITVTAVSARDRSKDRGVDLAGFNWHDDPVALASDDSVDVVAELIGGEDGPAKDLVEAAIANGKHVVTANKALIAHHGTALAKSAEAANVAVAFEAAVAGGIPIVKALREGLAANTISRVFGILNGTCNYILSEMRETGKEFDVVLKEAQELGYAEADPAFDVDGVDAAHKLAILTSLAFGCELNFDAVHIEGIRHISPLDIEFAEDLGYRIKLLGIARQTDKGIEQRVHPCMVPLDAPIAHIEDVFNAVVADGDFVDTTMYEGRGAGEGPTASAVVADIIDIARGRMPNTFAIPADNLAKMQEAPISSHVGSYYVRFMVADKPGVFATIAGALHEHNVSMEAVLQRGRSENEAVPVVLTTHEADEASMVATLDAIAKNDAVVEPPRLIRIESF
ncbi:MAG: homoserine dehydrogenase [Rhodospirillaceae bacterium]|nr:homoserine dehydrogenase [Rhodospirillaceae bacterium]MBT4589455.1 homoserine dehydrogenase [Rhodospirillaceae bacterium]MBT4937843.1 homoserine dehydrogenase [Rhodospirillaceae bacterium]MBT7268773.1 homoserine dehydrogenase [Rhodospirillaceae bacterium]